MKISRQMIGMTAGHAGQGPRPVEAFTLDARHGFEVTVWNYGATLIEVMTPDRHGRSENVVVRLPNLRSYEDRTKNPYLGATLGRYARCIARGRFQLDGREYQLYCNHGRHHFHGGLIGFDQYVWDATTEQGSELLSLRLRLDRPDGDEGYPGALSAETVYRVYSDGRLAIEYRATATASTVVALTNHAYWNLAGSDSVGDHQLGLNATRVVPTDDELIPTGPRSASSARHSTILLFGLSATIVWTIVSF